MSSADYPIKGPPTISLAAFTSVLKAAGSPAASQAAGIYQAFVAKGVNPALGLAIMQHESDYGTKGIAIGRNNPYGNRYYASEAAFGAVNVGGWAKYPNYVDAAKYEAALLAGPLYAGNPKFDTARTFAIRYAPAGDGSNNPNAYGNAIVAAITKWGGKPIATGGTPTASKPAVAQSSYDAELKAYIHAHPKAAGGTIGLSAATILALAL